MVAGGQATDGVHKKPESDKNYTENEKRVMEQSE